MDDYYVRPAKIKDIDFLVETIIEAEKSGSEILSYTSIFGLSEIEARKYINKMLNEEVDGCDLSVSSFLIAEKEGQLAAALSMWVEGLDGELPSSELKGNLLIHCLPIEAFEYAKKVSHHFSDLHIECEPGTLCIGGGYVAPAHRGKGLLKTLNEKHIINAMKLNPPPHEVFAQIFSNNLPSIKTYEKLGFEQIAVYSSKYANIKEFFPSDKKILLRKQI